MKIQCAHFKIYTLVVLFILSQMVIYAQSFPQVFIPKGHLICDTGAWHLVFEDNFSGSKINDSLWFTFNSNNSGNDDNWCEARIGYPGNFSIHRDENVVVSEGTLKLQIKQKSSQWRCASCDTSKCTPNYGKEPFNSNYTTGYISSRRTFNSGKIESRIRMPIKEKTWATCWTWHTNHVNEIDFAECTGGSFHYLANPRINNTYNLHAWPAPDHIAQNQKEHRHIGNKYPGQQWYNYLIGNMHNPNEWHDYKCEWDTAAIAFYLDGKWINTIYKYYQVKKEDRYVIGNRNYNFNVQVGNCIGNGDYYHIKDGFPYNNQSRSKLIFSVAHTAQEKIYPNDTLIDQLELDYVRVYQRYPDELLGAHLPQSLERNLEEKKAFSNYQIENNFCTQNSKLLIVSASDSTHRQRYFFINCDDNFANDNIDYNWVINNNDTSQKIKGKYAIIEDDFPSEMKINGSMSISRDDIFLQKKFEIVPSLVANEDIYILNAYIPSFERFDTEMEEILSETMVSEAIFQDEIKMKNIIEEKIIQSLEPYISNPCTQQIIGSSTQ